MSALLDIITADPVWSAWSMSALAEAAEYTTLVINPIIYAEVSIAFSKIEALDATLPANLYQREALPWEAGFLAGKVFPAVSSPWGSTKFDSARFLYRRPRAIRRLALLSRDAARYRTYFPTVELLTPSRPKPPR